MNFRRIGMAAISRRDRLNEIIMELNYFFTSSIYQTENPDYAQKLQSFYGDIIRALSILQDALTGAERKSWGSFTLSA